MTQNTRSTLHHSIGPGRTQIPPSTAVLASVIRESAGLDATRIDRDGWLSVIALHRRHTQSSDQNDRRDLTLNRQIWSLSHRLTRDSTFVCDIIGDSGTRLPDRKRLASKTISPARLRKTWHDATRTITFSCAAV